MHWYQCDPYPPHVYKPSDWQGLLPVITYFHCHCRTTFENPMMPKIRDSASKADLFEVTTTQTRRGKRITQIPVKELHSSPTPSLSTSPSKKQAWSPGILEHNADHSPPDQIPKRSRMSSKVRISLHVMESYLQMVLRHRTNFLKNIRIGDTVYL
jgi:hypothetical protein